MNGDGDTDDLVLHAFNFVVGTTTNLGLASSTFDVRRLFPSGLLVFSVSEAGQGDTDLNGDGDANDFILHTAKLFVEPLEVVEQLSVQVKALELPRGFERRLLNKLDSAMKKLNDDNLRNDRAAIAQLQAFATQVGRLSGRQIDEETANRLTTVAQRIIADIEADSPGRAFDDRLFELLARSEVRARRAGHRL